MTLMVHMYNVNSKSLHGVLVGDEVSWDTFATAGAPAEVLVDGSCHALCVAHAGNHIVDLFKTVRHAVHEPAATARGSIAQRNVLHRLHPVEQAQQDGRIVVPHHLKDVVRVGEPGRRIDLQPHAPLGGAVVNVHGVGGPGIAGLRVCSATLRHTPHATRHTPHTRAHW